MDERHPSHRPDPWSSRYRPRIRSNPVEDQIGIGRRYPVLGFVAVWVAGIALIVGLSFVLPARTAGIAALLVLLGLLSTARI